MPSATSYKVQLEIDAISDLGTRVLVPKDKGLQSFKLTVTADTLTFEPTCCGIKVCGKPFVVPLAQVTSNKQLLMPSIAQGMLLQLEQSMQANLLLKVFVSGDIYTAYANIEAQRRLARGEVLITGYLEAYSTPSIESLKFFPAAIGVQIYNAYNKLDGEKVDSSQKVMLGTEFSQGHILLVRKKYGVEMFREEPDKPRASVFCQTVTTDDIHLHYTEDKGAYKIAFPGSTLGNIMNLKAELPSTTILDAPYRSEAAMSAKTPFAVTTTMKKVRRSISINRKDLKAAGK